MALISSQGRLRLRYYSPCRALLLRKSIVAIVCFILCITHGEHYAQIISNGSFEAAKINPGNFTELQAGDASIDNWIVGRGTVDYIGPYWTASDGTRSVDLNGTSQGSIYQTLSTVIGKTYYIKFDMSGNPRCDGMPAVKSLRVTAGNASTTYTFNVTGNSLNSMGWQTKDFEFVAISSSTLLNFESQIPLSFCGPVIDNVIISDCAGVPNGKSEVDKCGQCLLTTDAAFNKCADCAGVLNGPAVVDKCGQCLDPTDAAYNSCVDCAGVPNGTSAVDTCGTCRELGDPGFGDCTDCAGTLNGAALLDVCGSCLEPTDPLFDQCTYDDKIFIPNSFSPNGDGLNDVFEIFVIKDVAARITSFRIFGRWGEMVYAGRDLSFDSSTGWWDGTFKDSTPQTGVYAYVIEVQFNAQTSHVYTGDVTVTK